MAKRASLRDRRGGIVFDILLAFLLAAAGVVLWQRWKARPAALKDVTAGVERKIAGAKDFLQRRAEELTATQAEAAPPLKVVSVWLSDTVRGLLVKHGVKDAGVIKNVNHERSDERATWIEGHWQVVPPASFDLERFVAELNGPLRAKGLRVMGRSAQGKNRVLELGDGKRIYQKIIFQGQT